MLDKNQNKDHQTTRDSKDLKKIRKSKKEPLQKTNKNSQATDLFSQLEIEHKKLKSEYQQLEKDYKNLNDLKHQLELDQKYKIAELQTQVFFKTEQIKKQSERDKKELVKQWLDLLDQIERLKSNQKLYNKEEFLNKLEKNIDNFKKLNDLRSFEKTKDQVHLQIEEVIDQRSDKNKEGFEEIIVVQKGYYLKEELLRPLKIIIKKTNQ